MPSLLTSPSPTNPKIVLVRDVPHRLEPFGGTGWTVRSFGSSFAAADFVRANPNAAMPCWQRWMILPTGELAMKLGGAS